MTEPNRAIQEEELEALRAIFEDDWHDIPPKKTAWGTESEGGWWEVRLKAQDGRVNVGLRGRMTKLYPHQAPPVLLVDPIGLSAGHVQTLSKLLQEKAMAAVGAPMIFDVSLRLYSKVEQARYAMRLVMIAANGMYPQLADTVREWITDNHLPLPKPGEQVPTLMEEMAQREEAQRAAEAAQIQAEQDHQANLAVEQNRLLTEKIQLDTSRKEERARQAVLDEAEKVRQNSIASLADGELEMRELVLDEKISLDGCEGSWRRWILFGGRKEPLWTTYTAEPDKITGSGFVKASLPSLTVQVIDFSQSFYSTAQGRKRIDAVCAEIARLKEIKSDNVVRVYGLKRDRSPKGWERLIVLSERVLEGGRLRSWLPRDGFGEEVARDYIIQVLSGLADIHRKGATQKILDADFIILTTQANSNPIAKLSGTGYARRIADLHRSNPFLRNYEESTPDTWLSPDEVDSPYTYTSKRDIWHAGLLLLQMLFGVRGLAKFASLQILLQHAAGLSDGMIELVTCLLHPNNKKRLTAEEALGKLRNDDDVTRRAVRWSTSGSAFSTLPPMSPHDGLGSSPVRGSGSYFASTSQPTGPRLSRYRTDFEEVEFLGKGGFGEVVKARNRLDGRSYAIKKVKLRPEDNEQKVYREVNSLSRVSHQYIVRYYGCWLEDATPIEPKPLVDDTTPSAGTATTSEEKDIFATNFDDLSLARRDVSRSASFPRIRFANSNEDEDSGSEDSTSDSESDDGTAADPSEYPAQLFATAAKPVSLTDGTTDDGMAQRILYIQMEFVEKQTLREAISAGLSDEEVWRLLVQILQALAHMSSLSIVHRDLKPSNILLDAAGNVKIADFGLSTTEMTAIETASVQQTQADHSDRTSGIGTSLYIAPEVAISRSYNEKADMYSLGVILFEMCFTFTTSMERVHILTALRQPSMTFPSGWSANQKPNQREIVKWLLRHDPVLRPLATQLLANPLLPSPEKQKEYYDTVIAELTNPKSSQYPALLDALFDKPSHAYSASFDNRLDDYTYDNDHDDQLQVWLTAVISRLTDLLQRHGAVETYLPLLMPETTLLTAFPDLSPVRLLDHGGKIVQLPASDLLGMARQAARKQIERIKRYHVGRKYTDHPVGGQPRVSGELSFDIISPIRSPAADAELLNVVDKVISEFRGIRTPVTAEYEFHISHETILSIILASGPDRARPHLLKAIKAFGSSTVSAQPRDSFSRVPGLPKPLLDDLEQCCLADDFETLRPKLESIFHSAKRRLGPALDELDCVIKLARACGVSRRILLRPMLLRNAELFRSGFMFECVRRGKQREVVAFGGRYDSLLDHFREPAQQIQSRRVYGVGITVAVDQLARMVRKYESSLSTRLMTKENEEERSFGYWSPARCDVYVAAVAQVDLSARLSVIGELWRAGIRADLQYDDERSLDEVLLECLEQSTLFLVIPRANRPIVKVRSVLKRSEEEVPRNELCIYLRQAITEQRRIDASYASAEGSIPVAQSAAMAIEPKADVDIKLILPPEPGTAKGTKGRPVRKHRHVTKSVYYDKAVDFASTTRSPLPIIAVDLPASLLCSLALDHTWLTEDEAWRLVLAGVANADRRYAETVREAVRTRASGGGSAGVAGSSGGNGWVWLFSVRETRGFLLQSSK